MQPRPRRLVAAQAQYSLYSQRTDAVLLTGNVPDRPKPQRQWQSTAMKDRSSDNRDLPSARSTKPQPSRHSPRLVMSTLRTDEPTWPTQRRQVATTVLVCGESPLQFQQCTWVIFHGRQHYMLCVVESSGYPLLVNKVRPSMTPFVPIPWASSQHRMDTRIAQYLTCA